MMIFFIYLFAFFGIFLGGISIGITAAFSDMKTRYTDKEFLEETKNVSRLAKFLLFISIILLLIHSI